MGRFLHEGFHAGRLALVGDADRAFELCADTIGVGVGFYEAKDVLDGWGGVLHPGLLGAVVRGHGAGAEGGDVVREGGCLGGVGGVLQGFVDTAGG